MWSKRGGRRDLGERERYLAPPPPGGVNITTVCGVEIKTRKQEPSRAALAPGVTGSLRTALEGGAVGMRRFAGELGSSTTAMHGLIEEFKKFPHKE